VMNTATFYQRSKSTWVSENLEDYLGAKHVIPSNGTDALQIAMMGLGLTWWRSHNRGFHICSHSWVYCLITNSGVSGCGSNNA
jgi:hypothetical protein